MQKESFLLFDIGIHLKNLSFRGKLLAFNSLMSYEMQQVTIWRPIFCNDIQRFA